MTPNLRKGHVKSFWAPVHSFIQAFTLGGNTGPVALPAFCCAGVPPDPAWAGGDRGQRRTGWPDDRAFFWRMVSLCFVQPLDYFNSQIFLLAQSDAGSKQSPTPPDPPSPAPDPPPHPSSLLPSCHPASHFPNSAPYPSRGPRTPRGADPVGPPPNRHTAPGQGA